MPAVTHTIQIFATTTNYHPLSISQDNGATWVDTETADENFTTLVNAGDTVIFAHSLNKNGVTNNISGITNITPATFFEPSESPNNGNNWTGVIKSGNPSKGVTEYKIKYNVTGVPGNQTQDPKLKMIT